MYDLTPANNSWFLFGRITPTAQTGKCYFRRIAGGTGYTASTGDHCMYNLLFCTSNGSSLSQTGTAGGSLFASTVAFQTGPITNGPTICRIVQESQTSYAFYFYVEPFSGQMPT